MNETNNTLRGSLVGTSRSTESTISRSPMVGMDRGPAIVRGPAVGMDRGPAVVRGPIGG